MRTNLGVVVTMSPLLLLAAQLAGCQALSGLDELEPQPTISVDAGPDAGAAGTRAGAGGASGGEAGSGGEPPQAGTGGMAGTSGTGGFDGGCAIPNGAQCNLLTGCGCADDQHCQARGSKYEPTCVARGPKPLGSPCKSPDECAKGTCDHDTCSEYCDSSCAGGKCHPITGADDKPVVGVNVCWTSCQVRDPKSCPEGTTCQVMDTASGQGAFCLPPADPCPTAEDGQCDEPVSCAAGTDSKDCSCAPAIEGATCDLIEQCGCPKGDACFALGANFDTPECQMPGPGEIGDICELDTDCRSGAGCWGRLCKQFCAEQPDCPGELDQCSSTYLDDVEHPMVRACMIGCRPNDPTSCKKDSVCKTYSDGSFCIWCQPELEGAACNLTRNCGCEKSAGTSCALTLDSNDQPTAQCFSMSGTKPASTACDLDSECSPGSICIEHVCSKYCESDRDCTPGACGALFVNGESAGIGICNPECSPNSSGSCGTGTVCDEETIQRLKKPKDMPGAAEMVTTCVYVPLTTTCPTTNQRCDEPEPKGTGLCDAGFDTAECM